MKKTGKVIPSILIAFSTVTMCLAVGASIALFVKRAKSNGTAGEVSLRSYYECGRGTLADPYVITRPRHLYNLSRLQALGVYGKKTYFALGKVDLGGVDSNGVPMCYVDETDQQKPYLDMSNSNSTNNPINAIGSEALPFYGEFWGQNCEIKNLKVYASPEDAGLFGYIAHGSVVKDLFLTNVTINASGYTAEYANLYGPDSTLSNGTKFIYTPYKIELDENDDPVTVVDTANVTNFDKDSAESKAAYFYVSYEDGEGNPAFKYDSYNAQGTIPPTISINSPPSQTYTYSSLISGDLIKYDESGNIVPNLERVFEFFGSKRPASGSPGEDAAYPIQASSIASLIVSSVDDYGLKHSKVIMTLEFDFTLSSKNADFISMDVYVGKEHNNNIGLLIGHCDGTAKDCYVCGGAFELNNGDSSYYKVANGSSLGLIGLVGGTVENIVAKEADVSSGFGKDIGVLDFTTVYKDIINSNSFNGSQTYNGGEKGVTYNPISTSKYLPYLRKDNSSSTTYKYVTKEVNTVSFKGQEVISNTDLGVFTIATEAGTSGTNADSGLSLTSSIVRTEDVSIGDNEDYYIYYATGEYNRKVYDDYGVTYDTYREAFNSDKPNIMLPGYHFPNSGQLTKDSFDVREQRQNYFVRFKLDPSYRKSNGFYFSDVDPASDGGKFMANYFNYKLVDQNNVHIANGRPECGVMLKDSMNLQIRSFSASFGTPDLSYSSGNSPYASSLTSNGVNYVSNMVNFEVLTDFANVTVVAAPVASGDDIGKKGASLGVYRINDGTGEEPNEFANGFYQRAYNKPDYAFFMPDDDHLAYFDYRVNQERSGDNKGEIGVYSSAGAWTEATYETNATVPKNYQTANATAPTEYGYESGKTRLFAHTFYLPRGRYYLGSATGTHSGVSSQTNCKIYYVCAQGQEEGQLGFKDNVFSSNDVVERIDFTKGPRFNPDGSTNIYLDTVDRYTPASPLVINEKAVSHMLQNQRCYVVLVNSDRSLFTGNLQGNIKFNYVTYDNLAEGLNGKFEIATDYLSAILHAAVNNYMPNISTDNTNPDAPKDFIISLFGREGAVGDPTIVYSP